MKVMDKITGTIKPKITALYVYWTIVVKPFKTSLFNGIYFMMQRLIKDRLLY